MTTGNILDIPAAHRHFAADIFNVVWSYLDKPDRSAEEDRIMLAAAYASLYHWMNTPGVTAQQLSVGYWQLSRVQSTLKAADEAGRAAELARHYAETLPPFYKGCALEAQARAALTAGRTGDALKCLDMARTHLGEIDDEDEAEILRTDLDSLGLNP